MKAQDYYDKFVGKIFLDATSVMTLLTEFNQEAKDICLKRKTQRNESVVAVLREQNLKWNALRKIFAKNHDGKSPILEDGFKRFWLGKMPQFADLWK